jgi:hypothetical protein
VTAGGAGGVSIPGACFYGSSDGTASVLVFAQAYPDAASASAVSPEQMVATMNGAGVANAKAVTGIGDKAIEYTLSNGPSNGAVIFVFKSNVVLMIALTPAATAAPVEQLARTAVSRL